MSRKLRQALEMKRNALLHEAAERLLVDSNADIGELIHRIETYSKLLATLQPSLREWVWAVLVAVICLTCAGLVAPQLTVVPTPPLNQALERIRGTSTWLGRRPTRRRDVIGQQFLPTPAMIGDAGGHRWRELPFVLRQTRVRCADVRDRPDEIPAML